MATQDIAGISRRRWLQASLLAGTALAAGAYLFRRAAPRGDATGRLPNCLSFNVDQTAVLLALIEAVVPTLPGFPSAQEARVLDRLDEEVYFVSADVRDDILTAVRVLEYLPLVHGQFATFSRLSLMERQRVLSQSSQSRFGVPRAVASNLRLMVQLFYYGHRASWQAIGYDGSFAKIEPALSEQRLHFISLTTAEQT